MKDIIDMEKLVNHYQTAIKNNNIEMINKIKDFSSKNNIKLIETKQGIRWQNNI